ncbi:CBS domain-containing protein [Halobacillus shinanisalinarum]|uniref:CBS domain-containing protein n=1 Tax=Halobacillus shinanisalinarum TaxID=2932258 RepID=A0ABY4GY28_9BACI|nr:CBS domain-containing protein [Halobacillus shinanisalinarum]UOQ93058.1 CBS domain-containing protein [Halobacillus shinanisalinarum]
MKTVKDVMTSDVSVCQSNETLYDAASMMKQQNVGAVPIADENGQLMGMVTDRDLVIRGYAGKSPDSTPIQQVMSDHLYHVSPETSLEEASQLMAKHQVRRLPVVENGKLTGIISLGDLSVEDMSDHAAGVALQDISERPELH